MHCGLAPVRGTQDSNGRVFVIDSANFGFLPIGGADKAIAGRKEVFIRTSGSESSPDTIGNLYFVLCFEFNIQKGTEVVNSKVDTFQV